MVTDNKLLYLLDFGVPIKWQKHTVMHGFDPQNGTIKEFSDFCERLEHAMEDKKILPEKKKIDKLQRKRQQAWKEEASKKDNDTNFYCLLLRFNRTHDTNDCNTLKKDAAKRKGEAR